MKLFQNHVLVRQPEPFGANSYALSESEAEGYGRFNVRRFLFSDQTIVVTSDTGLNRASSPPVFHQPKTSGISVITTWTHESPREDSYRRSQWHLAFLRLAKLAKPWPGDSLSLCLPPSIIT